MYHLLGDERQPRRGWELDLASLEQISKNPNSLLGIGTEMFRVIGLTMPLA